MSYPSGTLYPGPGLYPGMVDGGGPAPESPGVINWDRIADRQIETGLDRGVLYPNEGDAVAWIGLTGVDEAGGEAAAQYFLDGRPYLILPKPKEFSAQLRAYTYPDAFAAIVGELEVADGMYLDSQMGDSFGLSYRTRIADSLRGADAGYKIHLVYNATVVPSAKSYGTIAADINPVEFSWDVFAVPLKVEGYRPTAHITIDTRHMDAERIAAIEDLIYGTEDVAASLPHPQTIFDLLNFGDMLIVTDNGDGTFQVEGSYHSVIILGDGLFELDHINVINNGDGTFTVSSTA